MNYSEIKLTSKYSFTSDILNSSSSSVDSCFLASDFIIYSMIPLGLNFRFVFRLVIGRSFTLAVSVGL